MRTATTTPALVPAPVTLRSGPELFRGHPLHRRTTVVIDGHTLDVRPVVPTDLAAVDRFFTRLSPRSRFLRFHAAVRRLKGTQLAGIVDVDHHARETAVARDRDGRVVAVGQFVAVGDGVAELGIAVADDWQRRGLGTRIVAWLADAAREEGLGAFTASVLAENRAAIGLFDHWPGSVRVERHGTAVEVLLSLAPLEVTVPAGRGKRITTRAVRSGTTSAG